MPEIVIKDGLHVGEYQVCDFGQAIQVELQLDFPAKNVFEFMNSLAELIDEHYAW